MSRIASLRRLERHVGCRFHLDPSETCALGRLSPPAYPEQSQEQAKGLGRPRSGRGRLTSLSRLSPREDYGRTTKRASGAKKN